MKTRKNTTSSEVKARWNAAHYTQLVIYLPKDVAAAYKAKCRESGLSYADIPKDAIAKFLKEQEV